MPYSIKILPQKRGYRKAEWEWFLLIQLPRHIQDHVSALCSRKISLDINKKTADEIPAEA